MRETLKACRRRYCETFQGDFDWSKVFQGYILDIGSGDCPLPYPNVTPFDVEDGDANNILDYLKPNSFDLVHGSNVLEHLHNPTQSLNDWISLTTKGGYILFLVPDWSCYEGKVWPSRWNGDHKSSWSQDIKSAPTPIHIHIPEWLKQFTDRVEIVLNRLVDKNYDYTVGTKVDQTFPECDGVETFHEVLLQKK